jgi:transformation/transcription domain-associated protein
MADFHDFIRAVLVEGPMNAAHVRAVTSILGSVVQVRPESIHDFSALLLKVMRKVAGDQQCGEPGEPEQAVSYLLPILDIVRTSISFMPPESRKGVLQGFIWLLERTQRLSVCSHLLDIARDWALHRQDSYPNQKDKAGLLLKMTRWERFIGERKAWAHESLTSDKPRDFASLFTQFLEAVYSIYTHPTLRRSDLTSRLENPFLLGCRSRDTHLRERFITLLDTHVPRSLFGRLSYVMGSQSWEPLADHNWIYLALHLILGAVDSASPLLQQTDNAMDVDAASAVAELQVDDLLRPLRGILILDPPIAHDLWVSLFPTLWARLSRREQVDLTHHMITLLSKEYHLRQSDMRPNVIQTFLAGLQGCVPPVILPPHLVKYLAKTFGAWHSAAEILADTLEHVMDEVVTRDIVYDSLAELYAELAEEDTFCGLWRRRAVQAETSVGVAFQQNGLWEQAAGTYEQALGKTKNASLPFVEPEYCLWEDHWVLSQEKLQQWDILYDLGRNENNYELVMESTWRIRNWSEGRELVEEHFSHLPEAATPRRCVFAAFLALLRNPPQAENSDFHKSLQDGMKLTLHKWVGLPARMSQAHVPLLQHFQQFTELQEAVQIFSSLSTTNGQNLEKKAHELKLVLQAWRERLPNASDDISVWSDLVAWRKNVFNAINQVYLPLVQSSIQGNGNASSNASTLGYRGFHETAWIINRFAQTARKHELLEVCMAQLTTIYTLPNIEISEAFLKLREQARCHYQRRGADELQYGLDVVNNTNLMYFSMPQKAEFFTLKGMFHAKAQRSEDANQAFAQAVHTDMYLAKAWAQWGKFHDAQFKREKTELQHGANAVSCYLQAAGLYKSGKSRPLLSRVLWLLSVEDPTSTISRQFDQYKGEGAFWYWITFIPQLCLAVSHREVKQARYILLNLAKIFPQVRSLITVLERRG